MDDDGPMSDDQRSVRLDRITKARFLATNARGGTITVGEGTDADFTPVELLLVAIGACTAIDVDYITAKRAEATEFRLEVLGEKVRDEQGNHLTGLTTVFRVRFPDGEPGDAARAVLPDAVAKSHDRLCTVSRTVEIGTPVAARIE
jgi:uncharacterized OsmC-like protein